MAAVCCGCVQPASTKPRKTYNILVPGLFDGEPIKPNEPLDSSMRRKIQKLQEYVQMSPAKIPKVSRRLMRKIKLIMRKPGTDNMGHIKVAVHAYCYLLAKALDDNASYSASYFATELVTGPDAVIPLLLKDGRIELRTLGAELLAVFTHSQPEVDNQLDAIQDIIPQVCKAAKGALHADRAELKVQDAQKRQQAGDKMALANPLDLIARKDPAKVAALEAACLRALSELLLLCKRGRVLPRHFELVEGVVLGYLEVHAHTGQAAAGTPQEASAVGIVDHAAYEAMGVAKQVPLGTQPTELAAALLQVVADFTRDIASVHKVMDSYFHYMDTKHAWHNTTIREAMARVLHNSGSEHQFPVFTSMLRHASAPSLAPLDCVVLVELAAREGCGLPQGWALSALAVALQELPRAWEEQAQRTKQHGLQAILDLFRRDQAKAASHTANPSSSQPALTPSALADAATIAAANGAPAPASVPPSIAATAGSAAPAAPVSTSAGSISSQASQQHLALLKDAMLSAVSALARRVGSVAELSEAAAIGLRATATGAASATAAAEPSLAAAMALACVAEAVTAAAESAGREAGAQVLPGGVVPPALIAALLPVLQSTWPAVMRSDACRVLLAVLPCAPQGIKDANQALTVATMVGNELLRAASAPKPATDAPISSPSSSSSPADDWTYVQFAALDNFARCSLRGSPKPAVQLRLARSCLKLARRWGQHGYRGSTGNAVQAMCVVMVYNGILEALSGTTGTTQLLQHRVSVHGTALPALPNSGALPAAQPATLTPSAADSTLFAMEAAVPSANQASALEAALLQVPLLVKEHGDQLPGLLRAASAAPAEAGASDTAAPERFQDKVNTLLLRRMSTLRKDLVQVSELLRDTIAPSSPEAAAAVASIGSKATPPAALVTSKATADQGTAERSGVQATLEEVLALSSTTPAASSYTVGDVQIAQLAGQLEPLVR